MTDETPFTHREKRLVRTYALYRERMAGYDVVKVRLLSSGDARGFLADGRTYLIDPIEVLYEEALRIRGIVRFDA